MSQEDVLDRYRVEGTRVRVIRDASEDNDVIGFVVAWNDEQMMIRKRNRKVVKLPRDYTVIPADADRPSML